MNQFSTFCFNVIAVALLVLVVNFPLVTKSATMGKEDMLVPIATAEKMIFPKKDIIRGWGSHQISRGGMSIFFSKTTTYDMSGMAISSSSFMSTRNLSGTLVAVPIGDYVVEQAFLYRGVDGRSCHTGAVVSVAVQLSCGSKSPNDEQMQKTVKDLACVGMALSASNGGRPARIMALKKSVAKRFGGKNPRPHYDAQKGKVYFLIEDCRMERADPTFVPATPEGTSRSQREKLAKLHRDKDNGGLHFFSIETQIHPVGSPHIPQGEGWTRL